jgi:hypothetical protein
MVSLSRRQVLIGGATIFFLPAISLATPERLILSGRIVGQDHKPLAGVTFENLVITDADGRFMLVTDTHCAGEYLAGARRDGDGTWRATVSLTR